MRYSTFTFIIVFFVLMLSGCDRSFTDQDIDMLFSEGQFVQAEILLSERIGETRNDSILKRNYIVELETLQRVRKEFPYKQDEVKRQLEKYFPSLSEEEMLDWEASGELEMRIIDGEKRYFSRAVSNFLRLNSEAKKRKERLDGKSYDGVEDFQQKVIPTYFEGGIAGIEPFDKQKIKIIYTVELKPNAVPDGELVRCWLPYPRIGPRLSKVDFLHASLPDYQIAPEENSQRSIYMEQAAVKDISTIFSVSYIIQTAAQWFDIEPEDVKPYDTNSELYLEFTAEQKPHIVFNDKISTLAKTIVGEEKHPLEQVKLLYYWINDNIPWAGALEYSVMESIPDYVLEHRRGDCGMQTFLFLSMARSLGIPCKWQSGWYLLPQEKNLHDWAEVYYEGIGWVPVDPSFKLIDSDDKKVKEFYMNGLDSYRLIINDAVAQEFMPKKKYYRSEPYDFQRGELEWKGGNLYFDTWTYKMEVEYLDK